MKTILLLVMNLSLMSQGNYTLWQRHNDSLKIYLVYKDQIAFMEQCSQNKDYESWVKRSQRDDSLTSCEKYSLKKWNHKEYKWIVRKEMEGFGEAFMYGVPDSMTPIIERTSFSIIEIQTRFITRPDGKTIIPFIERWWFDANCRLLKKDRLNPVTHADINMVEDILATSITNGSQCLVSTVK